MHYLSHKSERFTDTRLQTPFLRLAPKNNAKKYPKRFILFANKRTIEVACVYDIALMQLCLLCSIVFI